MIEFLFAIVLGMGSVVLATISIGNLVDKKEEVYDISISTHKIDELKSNESNTQNLDINGETHTYTISKIGNNKLLIGESDKSMADAIFLTRIGDQYVGHTDDPNINKIVDKFNAYETKKTYNPKKSLSDEIDWIQ